MPCHVWVISNMKNQLNIVKKEISDLIEEYSEKEQNLEDIIPVGDASYFYDRIFDLRLDGNIIRNIESNYPDIKVQYENGAFKISGNRLRVDLAKKDLST